MIQSKKRELNHKRSELLRLWRNSFQQKLIDKEKSCSMTIIMVRSSILQAQWKDKESSLIPISSLQTVFTGLKRSILILMNSRRKKLWINFSSIWRVLQQEQRQSLLNPCLCCLQTGDLSKQLNFLQRKILRNFLKIRMEL